jgi:hypothetical protein
LQHAVAPRLTAWMMARNVDRNHFQDRPAAATEGNLFAPIHAGGASAEGGWTPPHGGARRAVLLARRLTGPVAAWRLRQRRTPSVA